MTQQEQQDKQAFFALHLGSELIVPDEPKETWYPFVKGESGLRLTGVVGDRIVVHRIAEELYDRFHQTQLHLNSLANITDEDLQGLSVKTGFALECFPAGWRTKGTKVVFEWKQKDIDYLRSRGYLLPYKGYSVDRILEMGWAKLKGGDQ